MKSTHKRFMQITMIYFGLFAVVCHSLASDDGYPVVWTKAFYLADMMEKIVAVKSQQEVNNLLTTKWYSAFEVARTLASGKEERKKIAVCQAYFNNPGMEPVTYRDYEAYIGLGALCKAGRLIANAKPAGKSHLSGLLFDTNLPDKLPKQVAMVLSTRESERIAADKSKVSWSDVEKVTRIEQQETYKTIYFEVGGRQTIELMARGDFNHDGIEDWMISSSYAVEGGSYRSYRIFVITQVSANGHIVVLERFSK